MTLSGDINCNGRQNKVSTEGIHPALVKSGDLSSWESFLKARQDWPCLELGQAWLESPEETFAPGKAWFAITPADVIVGVEFTDKDIFNPATRLNELGFLTGDVMELFWKPSSGEAYYEIHVSPMGQILQLKFPGPQPTGKPKPGVPKVPVEQRIKPFMITEPLFAIRLLRVNPDESWGCVVAVPKILMRGASKGFRGEDVTVSVSRYDYTRPEPVPTVSSTSQHMAKSFHRSSEWRPLFL
ncbi:MAG: hypothetical protein ACAI35_20520 [Candidatus Methylacidiphilales bacterium]|nr:hypothetical protein [Candidatus Methylacidiphilales bacterium]